MKPILIALTTLALGISTAALAQAPAAPPAAPVGPAGEVLAAYNRVKPNILKAAEKMPPESYSYKPTPEVRTFQRVVSHIIEAQAHSCTALNGAKFEASMVPSETADKATVVAALKASFDACDAAYAGLSDAALTEVLTLGPMKRSKITVAWGNVSHDNEQYATLALYLRLKGLVPPSSEK